MKIELCTSPFGGNSAQMFLNDQEMFCKPSDAVISSFAAVKPLDYSADSEVTTIVTVKQDTQEDMASECRIGSYALRPWTMPAPAENGESKFTDKLKKAAKETIGFFGDTFRKVKDMLKNWMTGAGEKLRRAWDRLSDTFISITEGNAVLTSSTWNNICEWEFDHTVFTPAEVRSEIIASENAGFNDGAEDRPSEDMPGNSWCESIIRKYDPEKRLTREQIDLFLERLGTESGHYTAAVNDVFHIYCGREEEFVRTFGFPMYDENGRLNCGMLLADMYAFAYSSDKIGLCRNSCGYWSDSTSKVMDRFIREYYLEKYLRERCISFSAGISCVMDGIASESSDNGSAKTFTGVTEYGKYAAHRDVIQLYIDPDASCSMQTHTCTQKVTQDQDMRSAA